MNNLFREGVKRAHEAVSEDSKQNYDKALQLYTRALEYMITSLNYEKNRRTLQVIKQQCRNVLQRAEEIKVMLNEKTDQASANAKGKNEERDKDNDLVNMSPLRAQLEDLIVKEKPGVTWEDVVGMEDAKQALHEAIVLPTKYPQLFVGKRRPPSGILLFGPPGTGKTYLAKACASMSNSTFFAVSSSALVSKYQGESEKLVRELFRMAKENRPSIVFIDEVDALGTKRSDDDTDSIKRIKNELLIQLQKADDDGGIMVLGATNTPYALDPALRRRFHRRIYIPLPDVMARQAIISQHIGQNIDTKISKKDTKRFAGETEGHSASDIAVMVRDALMSPVRRAMTATHFKKDKDGSLVPCNASDTGAIELGLWDIENPELLRVDPVQLSDFETSLKKIRPSVSKKDVEEHIRFAEMFGEGLGLSSEIAAARVGRNARKSATTDAEEDSLANTAANEVKKHRGHGRSSAVPMVPM